MTRRNPETCRQNQGRLYPLGLACRVLGDWAGGDRRLGGVTLIRALVWNCGNQSLRCQGRSTSGKHHEARVPMRDTGTDRPVVARKAGNAAGAIERKTLDDTIVDMLRPMISDWLDGNLPEMVEKALRQELAERGKSSR